MARWEKAAFGCVALAPLFLFASCAAVAESGKPAPATKAEAKPAGPTLSPEQQAAQDYLDRFKQMETIRQQEQQHLAVQHFKAGKDFFDMGDWKAALPHFEKALQLDPNNKEAQDYLARTRGLLGLSEGRAGDMIGEYPGQLKLAVEVRKAEVLDLFAKAKDLYAQGQYQEAVEAFSRVAAKARALAPYVNAGKLAEDAEVLIQKAKTAVEEKRRNDAEKKRRDALHEGEGLRLEREKADDRRSQALTQEADALLAQGRAGQARALANEILARNPDNAAAQALWERAAEADRSREVDRAIRARQAATTDLWRGVTALTTPQSETVYMPAVLYETVRNREASSIIGEEAARQPEWETRIREALKRKVSFDFVETPLEDVASFLGTLTGVTLVVDREALKGQAVDITLHVKDMQLESALQWVCKLAGLKYGLRDEAIFISTPGRFSDEAILRIYDVSDLTIEIPNFKGNQRALTTDTGWGPEGESGDALQNFFEKPEEEDKDKLTGQALIEFIQRVLAPGAWEERDAEQLMGQPVYSSRSKSSMSGEALVDIIGISVGGRTWIATRTKE